MAINGGEHNGENQRVTNAMLRRDIEEVNRGQDKIISMLEGYDSRIRSLEVGYQTNVRDISRNKERISEVDGELCKDIDQHTKDIDKLKDRINVWGSLNSLGAVIAGILGIGITGE